MATILSWDPPISSISFVGCRQYPTEGYQFWFRPAFGLVSRIVFRHLFELVSTAKSFWHVCFMCNVMVNRWYFAMINVFCIDGRMGKFGMPMVSFSKYMNTCRAQKVAKIEITLFPCGNCDLTHAQTGIPRDFDWSKNRIRIRRNVGCF